LIREQQVEVHIEMVSAILAVDPTMPATSSPTVVVPNLLKAALSEGAYQLEIAPIVHDDL